jgi:hypothetical protein
MSFPFPCMVSSCCTEESDRPERGVVHARKKSTAMCLEHDMNCGTCRQTTSVEVCWVTSSKAFRDSSAGGTTNNLARLERVRRLKARSDATVQGLSMLLKHNCMTAQLNGDC